MADSVAMRAKNAQSREKDATSRHARCTSVPNQRALHCALIGQRASRHAISLSKNTPKHLANNSFLLRTIRVLEMVFLWFFCVLMLRNMHMDSLTKYTPASRFSTVQDKTKRRLTHSTMISSGSRPVHQRIKLVERGKRVKNKTSSQRKRHKHRQAQLHTHQHCSVVLPPNEPRPHKLPAKRMQTLEKCLTFRSGQQNSTPSTPTDNAPQACACDANE